MSDLMLTAVLSMPYDMAMADDLSRRQFYDRAQQALEEIERLTKSEQIEAQIEARDALLDFISENGTASEGVQHYLDRYVRAALAARDDPT